MPLYPLEGHIPQLHVSARSLPRADLTAPVWPAVPGVRRGAGIPVRTAP